MTFLNPALFGAGLACIAIPIIIHILMRRRRRPIPWAAMKFLLEAYRRQRRRMNLEQILLLASRCLLVALLALALGKPVLGAMGLLSQGPRTLYLLIDNSLASSVNAQPGQAKPALEASKSAAEELVGKLDQGRGDRVAIVALAGPDDPLVLPPTPDLAAASELIKNLRPQDSKADMAGALGKVRDELRRTPPKTGETIWIAALSEFRAGSADMESTLGAISQASDSAAVRLLLQAPAETPQDNISIVNVEPARTVLFALGESATTASTPVTVTLRRSGPAVRSTGVTKVAIETVRNTPGSPVTRSQRFESLVNWAAGKDTASTSVNIDVPVPEGQGTREPLTLVASIDRDGVAGDNTFRRPIDTRDRLEVALLSSEPVGGKATIEKYAPGDWLALALAPDADLLRRRQGGEVRVSIIDPTRALTPGGRSAAGILGDFDAVLVPQPDKVDAQGWRMIRAAADQGALVLISPPKDVQTHLWSDAMVENLGLDWTISRESKSFGPAAALAQERPVPSGADLLGQLSAELPELVKHVSVSKILDIQGPAGSFEPLLKLAGGEPLLVMGQPGTRGGGKATGNSRGLVLFLTAAPDLTWTDIPAKPLMVPLMQELVRQGVGRSAAPKTAVAGTAPVLPSGAAELALLPDVAVTPGTDADRGTPSSIPVDSAGRLGTTIRTQGLWNVRGAGGSSVGTIAFNADPQGGLMETRTREEVAHWLMPVSSDVTWLEPGTAPTPGAPSASSGAAALTRDSKIPPISLPLLGAALAIAAIEACLARWFSHAKADAVVIRVEAAAAAAVQQSGTAGPQAA